MVRRSQFTGNFGGHATAGGIASRSGSAVISDSVIDGNAQGAGITNEATMTIVGSTVSNHFKSEGAGITNTGSLTVRGSAIRDNTAEREGGGIANYGGSLVLASTNVTGNTAPIGGGILNSDGGTALLRNSIVTGNTALGDGGLFGGGILNLLGVVTLRASTVAGNTPDDCVGC